MATSAARIRYANRMDFRHCSMGVSATHSNRRVRTLMRQGLTGVTAAAMPIKPGCRGARTPVRLHPLYRDCPA